MRLFSSFPSVMLLVALLAASACVSDTRTNPITAERMDLSAITHSSPAVGVAIDPEGRTFVLVAAGSLYEAKDGALTLVHELDSTITPSGFTDIASVGEGRFVVSAQSDGFLLDLSDGSLVQHFCYEPGWAPDPEPGEPVMIQTSYALTYAGDTIYAQPQTSPENDPSNVQASFFASYDLDTGIDLTWTEAPAIRFVGGMAYMADPAAGTPRLLVGTDNRLSLVDLWETDGVAAEERLGRLGIDSPVQIDGLAVDEDSDRLVFIDGNSGELRTLPLAETIERARTQIQENQPLGS